VIDNAEPNQGEIATDELEAVGIPKQAATVIGGMI
jgi:hypothetical protein